MWYRVSNAEVVMPPEVDCSSSPTVVYVRKNFVLVPEKTIGEETVPAHYEWDERKMILSEYELYQDNQALKDYLDMIS